MPHIQVLQTSHPWTDGWRPSEMFAYDGQQTSKTLVLMVKQKIASFTIVNFKKMKNYENTLDNHENQPQIGKNHNIEKHRQLKS